MSIVRYQIRIPIGPNTAFIPTTRGGASELLRCATVRRIERARGVRRYYTSHGLLCVWAPATERYKRLKRIGDLYQLVWSGVRA